MQEIPSGKDGPILPARVAYTKKQDSLYLVVHATESSYCLDLSCMFYGIIFFSVFILAPSRHVWILSPTGFTGKLVVCLGEANDAI